MAQLAARYRVPLLRFFERRMQSISDSGDLVQEVLMRLVRQGDADAIEHLDGYMFQVAANVLRDHARRRAVRANVRAARPTIHARHSMIQNLVVAVVAGLVIPTAALARPAVVTAADTTYAGTFYTVHWNLSRRGEAADLYVSPSPNATLGSMKRVAAHDNTGSASIADPLGRGVRPYFYLLPQGAVQGFWTATRVVPLSGAGNFRDLGGYATRDGRHVMWGQLFRSNDLSNLTDMDYKIIDGLGIRLVCDLRTVQERSRQPTVWQGPRPLFMQSPKTNMNFGTKGMFGPGQPDLAGIRRYMIA
ncbi:MAG: tyrosine-protein phosphatase, partial [Steroidobacteraceae bacterium]